MQLIEKHRVEINCSNQETARRFQDEIAVLFEHQLYPKLEHVLEEHDVSEFLWVIEKIDVKVPSLVMSTWKQDLINSIVNQIEVYLKENRPQHVTPTEPQKSSQDKNIPKDKFYKQLLIHYLANGDIPENAVTNRLEHLADNVSLDAEFFNLLQAEIQENSERFYAIVSRWVLNVPYKLSKILAKETGVLKSLNTLKKVLKNYSNNQVLLGMYVFWLNTFRVTKSSQSIDTTITVAQTHFNMSKKDIKTFISALRPELSQENELKPFLTELDALETHLESKPKEDNESKGRGNKDDIDAILEALENNDHAAENYAENTCYINNAGLVIVVPFLLSLFDKLNYIDKNQQWKSPYFQNRAVLLTQYIICGQTKVFEHTLMLNKLLCGVGLKDTVWTEWEITEHEKEQSQKLLESVIEHWSALKNTSVATLRDSFLKRKAKLILYKNSTYKLIVEQQSIDVLLDRLPWGISTLKTPWMEQYLSCQWI